MASHIRFLLWLVKLSYIFDDNNSIQLTNASSDGDLIFSLLQTFYFCRSMFSEMATLRNKFLLCQDFSVEKCKKVPLNKTKPLVKMYLKLSAHVRYGCLEMLAKFEM